MYVRPVGSTVGRGNVSCSVPKAVELFHGIFNCHLPLTFHRVSPAIHAVCYIADNTNSSCANESVRYVRKPRHATSARYALPCVRNRQLAIITTCVCRVGRVTGTSSISADIVCEIARERIRKWRQTMKLSQTDVVRENAKSQKMDACYS